MRGKKDLLILLLGIAIFAIGAIGISRYAFCNGLLDQIWTYSDSSYTTEAGSFGNGDRVYVEVADTTTTGSPKTISVKNNTVGNEISVEVSETSETIYRASFVIYSGANDDENDKLSLFTGQTATITADLASDGTEGTKTISMPSNEIFIEAKELLSLSFIQSIAKEGRPVRIIIGVNQPVNITIRIFNLKGYIVYDFCDYITSEREWSWTGVNMYGQTVNNGTYICKITAKGANGSVVNRMKILGVLY